MSKKALIGVLSVVTILTLNTLSSFAAPAMQMAGMNSKTTPVATDADRKAFTELWDKLLKAAAFNDEQTKRLASELDAASKKMSENFKVLTGLMQKKATAKANETAKIDKRINLTEAERDLIVNQVKLKLGEFLTEQEVHLVIAAAFHGTTLSLSGEEHRKMMMKEMTDKMETKESADQMMGDMPEGKSPTMEELVAVVEKLNQNCEAVTLELVRASLTMDKVTISSSEAM